MASARVGLDVGTTAIKAGAYDSSGRLLARSEVGSACLSGPGGRSEQDMESTWSACCSVLRQLTDELDGLPVSSMGICAQGDGLWAIDAGGRPVGLAMLWNDTRAGDRLAALESRGATVSVAHACHTSLWPGASGVLWHCLSPEARERTAHVFTCGDWIGFKLTGIAATDYSNATIPFLDLATREYSTAALAALECAELGDRLISPCSAESLLGLVTADAATRTGLPEGLPVSVATLDLAAMILGMGLSQPGQKMMVMGTTAMVNVLTRNIARQEAPIGACVLHPSEDVIIRALAPTTGTGAVDWFVTLHPLSLGGENPAVIAEKLNALVRDVPPGANGVTFLPYLSGERAPFVAPGITASFQGLTAVTTRSDMGRAVLEGTAMSLRHCLTMESGWADGLVQLGGGGAKNPVWCQIIADITGVEIEVSEDSDHGLWGAACLGAAAAGKGAAINLVERSDVRTRYRPDPTASRLYDKVFERYRILSDASRAQMKIRVEH